MNSILLESKIHIPARAHSMVPRARLRDMLEQQIQHYSLVMLSAPAGYGKTTLLSDWAYSSSLPVAWLSAEEEVSGTESFLRYLLAAWETVQPEIIDHSLEILLESQKPDIRTLLSTLINATYRLAESLAFVIDDYQLIENSKINEALTFILDNLPGYIHFVLACRSDPALPLPRYRARGQLLEIGIDELAFTPTESADFLQQSLGVELQPGEIEALQNRTEGWIAGLQLAGLALRRGRNLSQEAMPVSGQQRYIADYLRQDVLEPLPGDERDFLLKTSLLDRMCAPLCETLTDEKNSQRMLEGLERENLFLIPLDDQREWFRYHSMFHDFLRAELPRRMASELDDLHRRAARWYLEQELPEPAFRHAVEARDADLVSKILERHLQAKLWGGEFDLLQHWLASIPQEWQSAYPMIGFSRTGFLLFTGQLDASIQSIDEIEDSLATADGESIRSQLARVQAIRCSIACFQNNLPRAETYASQAIPDLPAEDHLFQSILYSSLGDIYRHNGHWEQARTCYSNMLAYIHEPPTRLQSAHVYGALADLDLRQGHLGQAAQFWRKALEVIQARQYRGRFPLPLTGWFYIRMAEILYEWDELDEAGALLAQGLKRAEMGADVRSRIAGYLIAGRMKLSEGEIEAAQEYLERVRPLVESAQFSHWTGRFERFQLELWLAQDKLRRAVDWSDRMIQREALESQEAQLAVARVLIVKGDRMSLKAALSLIGPLLQTAETEGRLGIQIETLALQALAYWRADDHRRTMTCLENALRLAKPEGYVRLFADLGLPIARLLQEAHSRAVMPGYAKKLLAAFNAGTLLPDSPSQQLPEPLTDREEEILALLAAGLTNREIAEELVISSETVKKHAGSIYGKLGVNNRTEAAARARELDLLD